MTTSSNNSSNNTTYYNNNEKNVGIHGMEVYIPSMYILQEDLEEYNQVSAGKYTKGLGQASMGLVAGDVEDINSIALTVVHMLLEKYSISPEQVGRLEVGTETLVDKSKSTKTILMELFASSSSGDMEGATIVNACYGGTSALLNALAWVESDYTWDGRYAIVVACDIATYARGPARPTCGIGAAAFLIHRDAPLTFDGPRATYAANTWDFYKPDPSVEYPVVDGALSQTCYYQALEQCYDQYVTKRQQQKQKSASADTTCSCNTNKFTATTPDYFVFHAPYNKLVQKSYARLFLMDEKRRFLQAKQQQHNGSTSNNNGCPSAIDDKSSPQLLLDKWLQMSNTKESWAKTFADRELDTVLQKMASVAYKEKLEHSNYLSQQVGNTYTASVFLGLASLICFNHPQSFSNGQTICVFSYGSGAIATMYGLRIRNVTKLREISLKLNLAERLKHRECVHPSELDIAMEVREQMHHRSVPNYQPIYSSAIDRLWPGTYYLVDIDSQWKRTYARLPPFSKTNKDPQDPFVPSIMATPTTTYQNGDRKLMHNNYKPLAPTQAVELFQKAVTTIEVITTTTTTTEKVTMTDAPQPLSIVITGVSAGLPGGSTRPVFAKDNLERLVRGEQCIEPIPENVKQAMVEKHVNRLTKLPDGRVKKEVCTSDKVIQVAAQLQICTIDLSGRYGVPPGLAETMDVAAQVAVAAGMEALKSAGLVSGLSNHPTEWKLAEHLRDRTGVVYASSFPAMDAAVGEVMRFLNSRTVENASTYSLLRALRSRMTMEGNLSVEDESAFQRLEALSYSSNEGVRDDNNNIRSNNTYEFDRKFLFRVLVLGNAQLAQLAGCRGPNAQTNAACAGTTQAIAMAEDMLVAGRADRVVVIAGDNGSGSTLLPWLGSGFCALGAATTAAAVEDAALPFDKRRSGMVLGAGGIGMVLETEKSAKDRILASATSNSPPSSVEGSGHQHEQQRRVVEIKARLLATQYSNSAYHGAALDRKHIASELIRFLNAVEVKYGITKDDLATQGVYFSHETSTHASSATSCAGVEIGALREAFGDELLSKLLILNTKGFTGHPMVGKNCTTTMHMKTLLLLLLYKRLTVCFFFTCNFIHVFVV